MIHWNMQIYEGKEADVKQSISTKVVMNLSKQLLNFDWIVVTNNFYTSVEFALELQKRKSHYLVHM